jgi:hypothetical protein
MNSMTPQHLRALAHAYESQAFEDPMGIAAAFRDVADELDHLRAERDDFVGMFCDADEGRRRNWLALDVLRAELVGFDSDTPACKRVAYQRRELRAMSADLRRLRAVIENAPHMPDCLYIDLDGYRQFCTCWKADVIPTKERASQQ